MSQVTALYIFILLSHFSNHQINALKKFLICWRRFLRSFLLTVHQR